MAEPKTVSLWVSDPFLLQVVNELESRGLKVSSTLALVLVKYVRSFDNVVMAADAIQDLRRANPKEVTC